MDGFCDAEALLTDIGQLRELKQPRLSSLTAFPIVNCSDLSQLTRLESLYLTGSMLDDSSLAHLSGLRHIKLLSLPNNPIISAGLVHLSGLTELESLDLSYTEITEDGLVHLVPLKNCKKVTVRQTGVTVDGFSAFRAKQEAPQPR
jgi:Leucine-rich repeat (LRR) protein